MAGLIDTCRSIILGEVVNAVRRCDAPSLDAEDVVQDVLVCILEKSEVVCAARDPRAYVRTLARHAARRAVRVASRQPQPVHVPMG